MNRERLLAEVRQALAKTGFFLSEQRSTRGLCFDLVARRDATLLLVKVLQNVDALSEVNSAELKMIARTLEGASLVVGERSGGGPLEEGVVYSRFGVPILSLRTFLDLFEEGVPPFIFSAPGGLYVKLDSEALRRAREERQVSLGTLADIAGVSRRTIQMYLEGMSATVDIALRLEEFLEQPLVVPVNPLAVSAGAERLLESFARLQRFERDVFQRLERLGYEVLPTIRCPFEAFTQHEDTTLLTGIGADEVKIEQKAAIVSNIGRVVEKDAVLFVERSTPRMSIRGVPVIARQELRRAKDLDAVEELIAERKG